MVPNYPRKRISGWINYSCKVTSHRIKEIIRGYRGSKSVVIAALGSTTVKEQRVDGNLLAASLANSRCTLTDFERNYQGKILSNQINRQKRRLYTTKVIQQQHSGEEVVTAGNKDNLREGMMNPNFVSGFIDAEGCFLISVNRTNSCLVGFQVRLFFQINLHEKDKALLERIQSYFATGKIYKHGAQSLQYRVSSMKDLAVIVSHLRKYPLLTQKRADYELFVQAFNLIQNKEHTTHSGLQKIIAIKAPMNLGLSPELREAFSDIIPRDRPSVKNQIIGDPNWLSGFTAGEGNFHINIVKSPDRPLGFQCKLMFRITQHTRDEQFMRSLIVYLDCGNIHKHREVFDYLVEKLSDINNKIIPFFNKYQIEGVKSKDFEDFCKAAELMRNKAHLTEEGLSKIREIKSGMNTGRKWD